MNKEFLIENLTKDPEFVQTNSGKEKLKTVCPVCGQEMDETETGRQYCKECEEILNSAASEVV